MIRAEDAKRHRKIYTKLSNRYFVSTKAWKNYSCWLLCVAIVFSDFKFLVITQWMANNNCFFFLYIWPCAIYALMTFYTKTPMSSLYVTTLLHGLYHHLCYMADITISVTYVTYLCQTICHMTYVTFVVSCLMSSKSHDMYHPHHTTLNVGWLTMALTSPLHSYIVPCIVPLHNPYATLHHTLCDLTSSLLYPCVTPMSPAYIILWKKPYVAPMIPLCCPPTLPPLSLYQLMSTSPVTPKLLMCHPPNHLPTLIPCCPLHCNKLP